MRKIVSIIILLFLSTATLVPTLTYAAGPLTLFTPYTGLSVTPGETIEYSVDVTNSGEEIENVIFSLDELPEAWTYAITASGRDIKQLSIQPDSSQQIDVEVTVPLQVEKADYNFQLVANGNGNNQTTLPFLVTVTEEGTFKTELTSDQPNMEGDAKATFSYNVTLKNRTAEAQNYALSSATPDGWGVQFKSDGKSVTAVNLEPNASNDITVEVTPAETVKADTYSIPIKAATSTTSAEYELEAVITGTYDLTLTTPDGKLSTDITAGRDRTIDLVIENTGSTPLTDINVTASTPPNWESEFDKSSIAKLEAGEAVTVKAKITASDEAIAGDYVTTFTASTAEASSEASFRVSVETSTLWGLIGIAIILGVLGVLYFLFTKFGRR